MDICERTSSGYPVLKVVGAPSCAALARYGHLDSCIAIFIFYTRIEMIDNIGHESIHSRKSMFLNSFKLMLFPMREEKILRAHGGCLGTRRRRRTRQAAISCGEAQTALDPQISDWGNPVRVMPDDRIAEHIGFSGPTQIGRAHV